MIAPIKCACDNLKNILILVEAITFLGARAPLGIAGVKKKEKKSRKSFKQQ